jgi:hypothetical protein
MVPLWATLTLCIASGIFGFTLPALIEAFKQTTTQTI